MNMCENFYFMQSRSKKTSLYLLSSTPFCINKRQNTHNQSQKLPVLAVKTANIHFSNTQKKSDKKL